jgi:hypothetical protein
MIFWPFCAFIWFKNIEKMLLQMTSGFLQLESTLECHLVATIKHQPIPHKSEGRGPSKTKLESVADLVIPAKNHGWVLRIRVFVTDLLSLSDPTLVAQLRSVESLH